MKRILQTLFFFLLLTQICFSQWVNTNKNYSNEVYHRTTTHIESAGTNLDSLINEFMLVDHIPGLAACIIKDDKIAWEGYYGLANISENDSVNANTIFMLASISKTVTASALMQLYEQGRFQLDDSINAYLPFPIRNPYFPSSTITFRHLLTHSSSIRDGYYPYYWGSDPQITLEEYIIGNLTPWGSHYSPTNFSSNYPPGVFVSYCNIGISLCGYLVEVLSGVPFDQYCRDSIFIPLGMTNTSWFLRDLDTSLIAHPYKWNGSSYYDWGHYGYASYPDGELRTTVRSLSRWLITNINFGKLNDVRVLDSTTVRSMRTVEYWPPGWGGVGLGLVWMTWAFPNGRWVWYHDGRDYGVSTTMNLDEVQETGVIILTNVNPINENDFLSLQNTLFMVADTLTVSIRPLEDNGLPKDFTLRQNYPNPFNPTTTIKYSIPQSSKVVIKVYDVLGNGIETLVNDEKSVGTYELTWNAVNLPSGVYFYQLKATPSGGQAGSPSTGSGQGFVETKKMLLLK